MDHYKLVLPEHLNHYGNLFGGNLLKWIDEFAYITANLEFPDNQFVTIALDNVEFRHGVSNGEILKFSIICNHIGNSSVKYNVKAFGIKHHANTEAILFETNITFVNINVEGKNKSLNDKYDDFHINGVQGFRGHCPKLRTTPQWEPL